MRSGIFKWFSKVEFVENHGLNGKWILKWDLKNPFQGNILLIWLNSGLGGLGNWGTIDKLNGGC